MAHVYALHTYIYRCLEYSGERFRKLQALHSLEHLSDDLYEYFCIVFGNENVTYNGHIYMGHMALSRKRSGRGKKHHL